ncbi:hypothetical protein [Parasphingorhabdus pacifica]
MGGSGEWIAPGLMGAESALTSTEPGEMPPPGRGWAVFALPVRMVRMVRRVVGVRWPG